MIFCLQRVFLQSSTIRATTWIVKNKISIPSLFVLIANMEIKIHIRPLFIFISSNFWLLMPLKPGVVFSVVSPRLLLQFFCSQILLICILHTMIGLTYDRNQNYIIMKQQRMSHHLLIVKSKEQGVSANTIHA